MPSTTAVAQESRVIAGQTRTIDQLELSPLNVRTSGPDVEDTATLEASILAEGQLNPIAVHPMRGRKGKWGAVAGGRRYRAIARLIDRGDLPVDHPVRVTIHENFSDAELIELSITENLLRKDLREHELFRGVARAAAMGHDVTTIAHGLGGQDVDKVAKWLRLGSLVKPVFDSLATGDIDVARASAYAATEDLKLQEAVFAEMTARTTPGGGHPSCLEIRQALKVGDIELDRLLRFVSAGAYRAAGGRYELDLFAEEPGQRGRVVDEGLLRELAEVELESWRRDIRGRCGRDVRFIPKRPDNGVGGTDWMLQVTPKHDAPDGPILLPEGDIVAHIAITDDGADVTWWWASRSAKHGVSRPDRNRIAAPVSAAERRIAPSAAIGHQYDDARQLADAALREDEGLTADGVVAYRSLRRAGLRGILIEDAEQGGDIALDYLVYSQFRLLAADMLSDVSAAKLGMRGIASESTVGVGEAFIKAKPLVDASAAGQLFQRTLQQLKGRPWATDADFARGFRNYRAEPALARRHAAAVVAGLALERSLNADGYRVPLHDLIGAGVPEETLRRLMEPTAEQLDLLPARDRLAIAEPYVEAATFAAWSRMKSPDITAAVLQVVQGVHPAIRKAMKHTVERWVHPLLRFADATPKLLDAPDAAELEAAE